MVCVYNPGGHNLVYFLCLQNKFMRDSVIGLGIDIKHYFLY